MVSDQNVEPGEEARLDTLGLKALELMQQLVQLKLKMQENIKTGSINLAKSRYLRGNRYVSSSQLPTEDSLPFTALRKVVHSTSEVDGINTSAFTILVNEPQKKQKSDENEELKDCINEPRSSCDPLDWFGVLVPQNLRIAQESFQRAIDLSVQIANVQAHLEALRLEFCTLKLEQMKVM